MALKKKDVSIASRHCVFFLSMASDMVWHAVIGRAEPCRGAIVLSFAHSAAAGSSAISQATRSTASLHDRASF